MKEFMKISVFSYEPSPDPSQTPASGLCSGRFHTGGMKKTAGPAFHLFPAVFPQQFRHPASLPQMHARKPGSSPLCCAPHLRRSCLKQDLSSRRPSSSHELVASSIILIVNGSEFSAHLCGIQFLVFAKRVQTGVKIPQLGIYITEEHYRIFGYHLFISSFWDPQP